MVNLTVQIPDAWFSMLVRMGDEMSARLGREVGPGAVMAALMKCGLRGFAAEACVNAAARLGHSALEELSAPELAQLDGALAKLLLHGARGLS
jgi:hypothetical protein